MVLKITSVLTTGWTFLIAFGCGMMVITYNPFVPDINTRFSEKYNEEKFTAITVGMDSIDIINLIGEPISKYKINDSLTEWSYSAQSHNAGIHDDTAWLIRELQINRFGKVIKIYKSRGFL
jgi:acyl carrier protein